VAATESRHPGAAPRLRAGLRRVPWRGVAAAALLLGLASARAVVLPEDRGDLLYHYYDGGGVTVSGPAVLVRKSAGDSFSVSGRYYVDTISSASIDVVTTASPYSDRREELGVGVDMLHGNSLASISILSSKEEDYLADTFGVNVTHDLFGGLTTLELGFSNGRDVVQKVNSSFQEDISRYDFRLGLSQILTRRLLVGLSFEDIAEDGYLNNPYRFALVGDSYFPERYPQTRDGRAIAVRAVQGFGTTGRPLGLSARLDYRYYWDTWDVRANTLSLAVQRYFGDRWIGELRGRYYQQNAASFYADSFPREMNYMARDKELSTFHSYSGGVRVSWQFAKQQFLFFDKASLNFAHDLVNFDYDDFTDVRNGQPYSFTAHVLQLYVSAWY
jgi:hypothetical protein